jgi:hypothetical protein
MDFNKLTRLFIPLTIKGVFEAKRLSHDRLVEKIGDLDFVTRSVTELSNELEIRLQILDEEMLHHLLSGEANKFWLASMFSLNRARQVQIGNAAWQAVEHYYSAYYAVHFLLRASGVSLTNLDSSAVSAINNSIIGGSTSIIIPTGLYVIEYDEPAKTLILKKKKKRGTGGSHQDAWRLWSELIDKMLIRAETDINEYANTSIQLSEHRAFVVKSSDHYNPPEMRGEINYQFKGGVWIFERDSSRSIIELQTFIMQPPTNPARKPLNVKNLMLNNKIIIELSIKIFNYGARNFPRSISRSISHKYSAQLPSPSVE